MKSKIVWLMLSCLMVLSLVLAACAPKPAAEAPTATTPTPPEKATPAAPKEATPAAPKETPKQEVVGVEGLTPLIPHIITREELAEKPKYGGTAVVAIERDPAGFDRPYQLSATWHINLNLVYDELGGPDLSLSALGSNTADFNNAVAEAPVGFLQATGWLAESWEIPDEQTVILKIRKGVRWHNKPPVNGREMTASDVVFNLKREAGLLPGITTTYFTNQAPFGAKVTDVYVHPDDPWKVVMKLTGYATAYREDWSDKLWIQAAPESIEKYGDLKDWRNALGTGPYLLTDYVAGSSLTFIKNPNWWYKMPAGPGKGDQLPYIDKVIALIIPDVSTVMSALRTGKVDAIGGTRGITSGGWTLKRDDLNSLLKTNPEMKWRANGYGISGFFTIRSDSTDPLATPLMNQKVRWAMSMAIDRKALANEFYAGQAGDPDALNFGFPKGSPYWSSYDEMVGILERVQGMKPEEAQMVKKILEYHPEDAKKLLAEAGYPNGFKTTVMIEPADVDLQSIIAGYLKQNLNIELALDLKTTGVFASISGSHTYPAAIKGGGSLAPGRPERWLFYLPGTKGTPFGPVNWGHVYDPVLEKGITGSFNNFADIPKRSQIIKETTPYAIWLAWTIYGPAEYNYNAWQPWFKLYTGEPQFGIMNYFKWLSWTWLDQDMKARILKGK